jgi:UDP-glucose 4-epimerase
MQDKRVLVTGGAGPIGSNLANRLTSGNDVIAVDDTYLGTPENLDDLLISPHA